VQYVHEGRVSAHFFDVLAIHPLFGRSFSADDDRPNGPKVAILSYNLWQDLKSSNDQLLGQAILLKGEPYTVIGILSKDAETPLRAAVYTAIQATRGGEGGGTNFDAIVRLRADASWEEANAQINRAWALSSSPSGKTIPQSQVNYYLIPLRRAQTAKLRPQLLALMLAAGLILLIACANLAGLMLVRVSRRNSEVATRLALGASRWQVQKQFWIENLVLAFVAGLVGLGVGFLVLHGLMSLLPEHFLPVLRVSLDGRVLAFTLFLSLGASLVFGMFPAFATRRVNLRSSISRRTITGSGSLRLRQVLVAGEVALSLVLLTTCGLLIRTTVHLETLAPGFNADGVVAAKASLDDVRFHDPVIFRKLLDESLVLMRRIPGVQNAAVGLTLPYERALNNDIVLSDGKNSGQHVESDFLYVTPGYFDTLHMSLSKGRVFTDEDGPATQHVAIVNHTFSLKFFGGGSPVGHYINQDTVVVGEVADVSTASGLSQGSAPLMTEQSIYLPAAQVNDRLLAGVHVWAQPSWIVRTAVPTKMLTSEMQRALTSVDSNLPFSGFYSVHDLLDQALVTQRMEVALLSGMSALALLMSLVGIFALVASIVTQRTKEIGVRIALGSSLSRAMLHTSGSALIASAFGIGVGFLLCIGTLPFMRSAVYGVQVYDARNLIIVIVTFALVSLLAAVGPTLRILRIDPAQTLREL
jgi:predicted permease